MHARARLFAAATIILLGSAARAGAAIPTAVNGTLLRGEPSCVGLGGGQAVCGALSSKGSVVVSRYNGTSWTAWKTLAGTVSSPPSCTSDGAGKVVCAVRAVNGQLQYSVYDPVTNIWTKSLKVAGSALYSGPSCAKVPGGKVLCAARGGNGSMTYSVFDGVAWSAFSAVGGAIIARPGCSSDDNGGVICVVIVAGNVLHYNRYASGAWGSFVSIGGLAGSDDVRCVSLEDTAPFRVSCFVQGLNSVIFVNSFNGTAWTGWGSLGLQVNYGATCGVVASGQILCGAVAASDNSFNVTTWNGSSWAPWAKRGGTGVGTPSCAGLGTGQVVCAFHGIDSKMYHAVEP